MDSDRARRLHEILDAHNAATAEFRASRDGIADALTEQAEATAALSRAMLRMGAAIRAGDTALAQVQTANRAAQALLRDEQ